MGDAAVRTESMNDEVACLQVGEMDSRCRGVVMIARVIGAAKSRLGDLPVVAASPGSPAIFVSPADEVSCDSNLSAWVTAGAAPRSARNTKLSLPDPAIMAESDWAATWLPLPAGMPIVPSLLRSCWNVVSRDSSAVLFPAT